MAKALLGHIGNPDLRLVDEMRRLQQRVKALEEELLRLRAENDSLAAAVEQARAEEELLTLPSQPAFQ